MGFDSPSRHHLSYLISMCYERAADLSDTPVQIRHSHHHIYFQ
jgi:hypothetical protein